MTTAGQGDGAGQDPQAPVTDPDKAVPRWSPSKIFARKTRVKAPRRHRSGLLGRLVFLALVFGLGALTLQLLGRTLPMPVWVVAEVEARLNRSLADALPGGALSLGSIDLTVGEDWVPQLVLEDLRLLQAARARFGVRPPLLERDSRIPPFPELLDEVRHIRELQRSAA